MSIYEIIGVIISVIGMLVLVVKLFMTWAEKRHELHYERWKEHAKRFEHHDDRITKNEELLERTRDELYRDYVRDDHLKEWRKELREDFDKIFTKLGGLSRDLNQMIGKISKENSDDEA